LPKRRIAILGGGIAALTAAYYLTRTEALRAKYAVTLYQIGWRLGGKGATGRRDGRIEEHGLHVWFGYYSNAFRMLREVYRDWRRDSDNPLESWRDALKPQSFTPIGPDFLPFNWPTNAGVPGDGHLHWTPWQAFTEMLGLIAAVI
jgi:protoporphyrinogen oxidase